jgi:DNA-binding XRE family transcriptional regulator
MKNVKKKVYQLRYDHFMITLPQFLTPPETATLMAQRFKTLRLQAGFKRSTLAHQSGVSEASLKRTETPVLPFKSLDRVTLDPDEENNDIFLSFLMAIIIVVNESNDWQASHNLTAWPGHDTLMIM